jgi:hypothetical protein
MTRQYSPAEVEAALKTWLKAEIHHLETAADDTATSHDN